MAEHRHQHGIFERAVEPRAVKVEGGKRVWTSDDQAWLERICYDNPRRPDEHPVRYAERIAKLALLVRDDPEPEPKAKPVSPKPVSPTPKPAPPPPTPPPTPAPAAAALPQALPDLVEHTPKPTLEPTADGGWSPPVETAPGPDDTTAVDDADARRGFELDEMERERADAWAESNRLADEAETDPEPYDPPRDDE